MDECAWRLNSVKNRMAQKKFVSSLNKHVDLIIISYSKIIRGFFSRLKWDTIPLHEAWEYYSNYREMPDKIHEEIIEYLMLNDDVVNRRDHFLQVHDFSVGEIGVFRDRIPRHWDFVMVDDRSIDFLQYLWHYTSHRSLHQTPID